MPTKHARLGPSKMKNLELCPHYKNSPDPNAASLDGTLCHDALERDDFSQLDDEQKSMAQMCKDQCDKLLTPNCTVYNELKLDVIELDGEWVFGTADKIIIDGDHAYVIDYKFGRTEVDDAEVNIQGQCYTLGTFNKFPQLELVTVMFLLPRQDAITQHTYSRRDMDAVIMRILAINSISHDPDAPFNPTAEGCAWCANKSECPALRKLAITTAHKHAGLPLPTHFEPGTMVSVDDRNKAQLLAPILEDWCKQVKKNNTRAVMEEGLELPDFTLMSRKGSRKVVDMAVAYELLSQQGVSPIQFMLNCSIKIGDLDGLIRQAAKDKGEPVGEFVDATMIELERLAAVQEGNPVTYLRRKKKKEEQGVSENGENEI